MPRTLVYKILASHLVDGELVAGSQIGIRIDQAITQDATGTTAYLLAEAMGIPRVRTELAVSYVDHNLAQFGPENHNDHLYLQSVSAKLGAYHSRPGNGICHQVHLERFARPGRTLLGSDSHTPTAGGIGSIAIGAGGLDVAVAMGGGAFYTTCPRVIGVQLIGRLGAWVEAKDVVLRLLSILTTRGNVGCVVEYFGPSLASLPVPARATCTNMGAELGVTTSIFPSDDVTRQFLRAQGRPEQFCSLVADEGATYDRIEKRLHAEDDAATLANIRKYCTGVEISAPQPDSMVTAAFDQIVINLDELEPLAACPSSPDNVASVSAIAGQAVRQVVIGSCTNSSYQDLMLVGKILAGRTVHPDVELGIAPGSSQVLNMLADNGALAAIIASGARILESGCGPCIGQGFSPTEGAVSLRTFNRNFAGRSGTSNDLVYLVSPATALAAAITGRITDPRDLTAEFGIKYPSIKPPRKFPIDDGMISNPPDESQAADIEIVRPSTIVKPPSGSELPDTIEGSVAIKVGDKITTDHIMPAGTLLKYRSNVPQYAEYVFNCFNESGSDTFADRVRQAKKAGRSAAIVAGLSYGQGSSREHAALCPMYLGVRMVIAKSIERIHQANLVNFAILPLTFACGDDYEKIKAGDELLLGSVTEAIASSDTVIVTNTTGGFDFECSLALSEIQRKILAAGGLLNYTRLGGQSG